MKLALDIGGSHIRIAEVSGSKIKNKITVDTPKDRRTLLNQLDLIISKFKKPQLIGIGVAGFVRENKIIRTPHLDLSGYDLADYLKTKYKCKVLIKNDVRAAALAEAKFGAGKGKKNFIYIAIGTGIGGAIFTDGKLYTGDGFAGEVGHMFIKNGEYESVAAGDVAMDLSRELLFDRITEGIMNLVYVLDPELIVLSGGVAINHKDFAPLIQKKIAEKHLAFRETKVVNAKLVDAGLVGAVL